MKTSTLAVTLPWLGSNPDHDATAPFAVSLLNLNGLIEDEYEPQSMMVGSINQSQTCSEECGELPDLCYSRQKAKGITTVGVLRIKKQGLDRTAYISPVAIQWSLC